MNDKEKKRIDAGLKALESSSAARHQLFSADGKLEFELIKMAQGSGHNKYCVIDHTKFLGKGMEARVYMAHFVEKRRMSKTKYRWDYKDAAVKIFNQDPSSTAEFTIAPRYLPGSQRINIGKRTLFLMPYQPGEDLISAEDLYRLMEGKSTPKRILDSLDFKDRVNVAAQLMDECHRHASSTATTGGSTIHGDIKFENIMIWRETTSSPIKVKIVDYGTAIDTTSPNESTDVVTGNAPIGSLFFMSPEASKNELTTASDLYSCVPILAITLGASPIEVFANKVKNEKGFLFHDSETSRRNLEAFMKATYNVSGIMPDQDENLRKVAIAFLNRMQIYKDADRPDNDECLHFFKTLERIVLHNNAHPDQTPAKQSGLLLKLQLLSEGKWQSGLQNYAFDNVQANKALIALDKDGLLKTNTIQWLSPPPGDSKVEYDDHKVEYTASAILRLHMIHALTSERLDALIDDNKRHSHVARALVKLHRPPVRPLTPSMADSVFDKAASIAEAEAKAKAEAEAEAKAKAEAAPEAEAKAEAAPEAEAEAEAKPGDFTKAYEALTAEIRTKASPRRTRGISMPDDKYPGPARVRTPTKKTHHKYPGPARQRGSKKPPPPLPPFRRRPTD